MSLNFGFLLIRLRVCISGSVYQTGAHNIIMFYYCDFKVLSAGFFHCEVTVFPFVIYKYLGTM